MCVLKGLTSKTIKKPVLKRLFRCINKKKSNFHKSSSHKVKLKKKNNRNRFYQMKISYILRVCFFFRMSKRIHRSSLTAIKIAYFFRLISTQICWTDLCPRISYQTRGGLWRRHIRKKHQIKVFQQISF